MKNFIYFILILSFVNIIISFNVSGENIMEYETSTLFESDGYEYKITYPVGMDSEWSLFYGATDSTIYKVNDGIIKTIAIITKQKPSFDGIIEVFILEKKGYKSLFINKDNSFVFNILNLKNENFSKLERKIENFYKDNNNAYFSVVVNIEKNEKVILFTFRGEMKDKKQTIKEFVKIISSLTVEK